jgi:hypothetical protein
METPKPETASPFDSSPKAQLPRIDSSFFLQPLKEGQTTQQAYDAAQYDEDLRTGKIRPHFDKDGLMTLVKDTSTRVEIASAGVEERMESGPVGYGEQSLSVQNDRIALARGTDYGSLSKSAKEESTASWEGAGEYWSNTGNMFKVWADRDTPEYTQLLKDLATQDDTWDVTRKLAAVKQMKDSNPDLVRYAAANGFGIEDIALNSTNPFQFQAAVKEATRMAQLSTRNKVYNEITPHWYSEWALSARENIGEGLQDPGFMRDTIVTTIATAGLGGLGFAAARFGVMGGRAALAAKTVATQGMLLTGPMTGLVEGATFRAASGTIFSGLGNTARPIASRALGLFAEGATVGYVSSLASQKDDYDWKSLVFNDKKHFEYDYGGAVTNSIGAGLLSTGMMSVMRLGIDATRIAATASFAPASFKAKYSPKNFGDNLQSWTKNVANTFDNWATTADGNIIYGDQLGMGRGIAFMDLVDNHLRKFGDKRDFTKVMMNGSRLWGHFDPLTVSKMNYDMEAASKVSIEFEKATGIAGEAAMTGAAGHEAKALFGAMLDKGNLERMDLDYDDVKLLLKRYGEHGPQQRASAEELFLGESLKDKASPNRVEYRDHAIRVERLLAVAGLDTKFRKNGLNFSGVLAVAEGHAGRVMDLGNTTDFRSVYNIGAAQRGLELETGVQAAMKEVMGLVPKRAAEGHVPMPQVVHDRIMTQVSGNKDKFYITDSEDPNYIVEVNLKDGTVTGSDRKLVTDPATGEIKIELDLASKADFTGENIIRADTLNGKLTEAETKVRALFAEEYTNREIKLLEKKLKEAKDPKEKTKIKAIADAIKANKPVRVDTLQSVFDMDKVQAVASLVIMKALGLDDVNSSIELARAVSGVNGFTKGAVGQIELNTNDLLGVNALIRATTASDMGTCIHEMGHFNDALFMGDSGRSKRHAIGISDEMFDAFKDWAGVEKGKDIHTASVAVREKIANGWSVYIQKALQGKATSTGPLTSIQRLFHKLGDNIGEVGAGFKSQGHLEKGFELSPAADRVFDMLLNRSNDKISDLFDVAYQKLWKNLDKDVREELGVSILGEMRWNNYKASLDKRLSAAKTVTDPLVEALTIKVLKAEEITLKIEAATNSSISRRRVREWLKSNPTMTEAEVTSRLTDLVTEAEALAAGKRTLTDTAGHIKVVVNPSRMKSIDSVTLTRLAAEAVKNPDMIANVITRVDDVGLSDGRLYLAHSFMELSAANIIREHVRRTNNVKKAAAAIRKEAKAKIAAVPADAPAVVTKIATKAIVVETKAAILTEAGIPTKATAEAVAVAEADLVLRDAPELKAIIAALDTPGDIDVKLETLETVITPVVVNTAIIKAAADIKADVTAVVDRVEVPTSAVVVARRKAKPTAMVVEEGPRTMDPNRQVLLDTMVKAEAEIAQMKQEIEVVSSKIEQVTKAAGVKSVSVSSRDLDAAMDRLTKFLDTAEYKEFEAFMLKQKQLNENLAEFMVKHEANRKMYALELEWMNEDFNRPPLAYTIPFKVWLAAREVALVDKKFVSADGVEVVLDTNLAIAAVARQSDADNASAMQAHSAEVVSVASKGTLEEAVKAFTTPPDAMPRRSTVNVEAKVEEVGEEVLEDVSAAGRRALSAKNKVETRVSPKERSRLDALATIILDNPTRMQEIIDLVTSGKEKNISSEYFEAQVRHLITTRALDDLVGMDEAELRTFIDMKKKIKENANKFTGDQWNLLDLFQQDPTKPELIAKVEKEFGGNGVSVRLTTYFRGLTLMANANTVAAHRVSQAFVNNVVNRTKYESNLALIELHKTIPQSRDDISSAQKSIGIYESHASVVRAGVLGQNIPEAGSVPKPTAEIKPLFEPTAPTGITKEKAAKAAKSLGISEAYHEVFLNKVFDFSFLEPGSTLPQMKVARLLGWMLGGAQGERFSHAPATRQQIEANPFLFTELSTLVLNRERRTITERTMNLKEAPSEMSLLDHIYSMNERFKEKLSTLEDGPEVMTPKVLNDLTHLNAALARPGVDGLFGIQFFMKAIEDVDKIEDVAKRLGLADDMPLVDKRAAYIAWARGETDFQGKPLNVDAVDAYYGAINKNRKREMRFLESDRSKGGAKDRKTTTVSMTRGEQGSDAVEFDAGKQAQGMAAKVADAELEKFLAHRVTLDLLAGELYKLLVETGDTELATYLSARRAIWGQSGNGMGTYIDNLNAALSLRHAPGTPFKPLTPDSAITLDNKLDARIDMLAKQFDANGLSDIAENARDTRLGVNRAGENSTMLTQMSDRTLRELEANVLESYGPSWDSSKGLNPIISPKAFKDIKANPFVYALATGEVKSVYEALIWIAKDGGPSAKFAKHLLAHTDGAQDVPIFVITSRDGPRGEFAPSESLINISVQLTNKQAIETVLHESLHALVFNNMQLAIGYATRILGLDEAVDLKGKQYLDVMKYIADDQTGFQIGLTRIAQSYLEFIKNNPLTSHQRKTIGDSWAFVIDDGDLKKFNMEYALSSIQEFISMGLTSPLVVRELANIKSRGPKEESVFVNLVEALTDVTSDALDGKVLGQSLETSLLTKLFTAFTEANSDGSFNWGYRGLESVEVLETMFNHNSGIPFRVTPAGKVIAINRLSSTPQSVRFNQMASVSAATKAQNDLKAAKGRLYKEIETFNQLRSEEAMGKRISVEGDAGKDVLGLEKQLVALKATVESRRRDLLGLGLHEETEPRDYVYIKDILKGVAPLSEPSTFKILDRIGKIVDPDAPVFNTMAKIGNYRSLNDNDRKAFVLDVVTKKIQNQMGDRYSETGIFSPITASVVGKRVRRLIGGGVDYHATADSDSVFLQFISKIYDPMMDLRDGELKGMFDMPSVDKVNVKLTNMLVKSGLMQAMDKVQGVAKNNAELTAINNTAWSYLARVGDLPKDIKHHDLVLLVINATNKFNGLANEMLVAGGNMHGGADPLAYGTIRRAGKLAYKDRAGFVKALHGQALRAAQANSKSGEMSVITAEALGWLSLRREDGTTDGITHVDVDLTSRLYEPLKAKIKDFDGKMEWNSKSKKAFSEILNDLDSETRALHDNGLISSKNYTELWKRAAGSRPDDVTALYTTMEIAGNRYLGLDDLSSSKSAKPRSESTGGGRKYGEERILTHNEIATNPELAKYFSQDIFSLVNQQMRNQLQDLAMTNEITNFFGGNVRLSMLDLIEVLNKTGEEYLGKSKLTTEEIKTRQRGYDRVKTAWESHTGKLARSQDSIDSYLNHLLENSRVPVMIVGGVRAALSSVPELARAILASDHNKGMLRQLFPNIIQALKLTRHSKRSELLEMSSSVHWIRHMASEHLMAKSSLMPDNPFNNVAFGGKQSGWFSSWANEWEAISGINELETSGFARTMNRVSMAARVAGGPLTFINKVTTTLHIHNAQLNLSKNSAKFMRLATALQDNPSASLATFSQLARSCGLTAKESVDLSSAGLLDPKYIQVLIDATKDPKNMTDGMLDVRKLMIWAQENPDTMAIREEAITRLGGYIGMTTRHSNTEPTLLDLRIAQSTFGKALNVFMQFLLSHSVQEIGRNRRYTKSSYARHFAGLLAMEVTANAMLRAYAGEDPYEELERNPVEYITKVSTSMPLMGSYQWLSAAMRQGAYASYEAVTGEDTFKEQFHVPGPLDSPINNSGDRARRGTVWAIDTLREAF